jgi:hypothetical protein
VPWEAGALTLEAGDRSQVLGVGKAE